MNRKDRAKMAVVRSVDYLATAGLSVIRRCLFRRLQWPEADRAVRRILVFRTGNIGDILNALPTFDAIRRRFPAAYICLLTSPGPSGRPGAADILPIGKWFDDYIAYHLHETGGWKGRMRLLHHLQSSRFDLFIDCNELVGYKSVVRNLIFARMAKSRYASGFSLHHQPFFERAQMQHAAPYRESERLYSFVSQDLQLDTFRTVRLPVSDDARTSVRRLLASLNIDFDQDYIVMHVGAKRPTNRWPAERYVEVADAIASRLGLPLVLTGSPPELPLLESVASQTRNRLAILCGQLSLSELPALLEGATLYVGNDTGPMHVAAAVGTPTVSIFSARDFPERWYPVGNNHIIFRGDAPCSPCFKEVCDRDLLCMDHIKPSDVLVAVEQQLTVHRPKPETGRECAAAE
jgi:ADP-heptose:LPS heptosyltransferase